MQRCHWRTVCVAGQIIGSWQEKQAAYLNSCGTPLWIANFLLCGRENDLAIWFSPQYYQLVLNGCNTTRIENTLQNREQHFAEQGKVRENKEEIRGGELSQNCSFSDGKMPPKKKPKYPDKRQKTIGSFFPMTSPAACSSDRSQENIPPCRSSTPQDKPTSSKIKEEKGQESMSQHSHSFNVKFSPSDQNKYTIFCDHPQTVLEAIKSLEASEKKLKSPDQSIIIQLGKEDKDVIVPTHFPCSLVERGETLIIISSKSEMIEKAQNQQHKFHPSDKYTIFYIDTVGGLNAKKKEIFQSYMVKRFKRLCVYGEESMTVAEVLRRDGRFNDLLGDFTLSDNDNPKTLTLCTQKVNELDQKTFKIQLKKGQNDVSLHETPSKTEQCKGKERSAADIAQQRGNSVRTLMEKQGDDVDTTEIYGLLRKQFPELREWMENRFPADSYQTELELRRENFGKIQKSFRQFHRIRMMLNRGKSVCKITVGDHCEGTGFVLFDGFILTNAHLFRDHVDEDKKLLEECMEVCALFNYEDPLPKTNFYYFVAEKRLVDFDRNLDYAILELNTERYESNQRNMTSEKLPPGLLKHFGPLPENGEACIIGHPAGAVKEMDPTFVIEKENRIKAIDKHLAPHKDSLFMLLSFKEALLRGGIEDILGKKADNIMTYHTFMYHGSSGSPVFDGLGRVVGLHTAGCDYGFPNQKEHVMEFAHSLLAIFESFVRNLKKNRSRRELLEKVREIAKGNQSLKRILGAELSDDEEETVDDDRSSTHVAKTMRF